MTEQRTAQQIRAYCEAASEGPWVTGPEGAYWPIAKYQPDLRGICKYQDILSAEAGNADNNADFIVNSRADLLAVLDAAVIERDVLDVLARVGRKVSLLVNGGVHLTRPEIMELDDALMAAGAVLNETKWLVEPIATSGESDNGSA